MRATETKVAPRENPLVPFALMKRMYAGMVDTRLLEASLARRRGEGKRSPVEGQEACRTAVLLNLSANDLVADSTGAASSAWMRGAELAEILYGRPTALLPFGEDASQSLAMAAGAAAALKRAKLPNVVILLLEARVKRSSLRQTLALAAQEELPLVFVVLPPADRSAAKSLAAAATKLGVPGIPVEAHDAVAICRVAQESILRARAGGGPALIECVRLKDRKRVPNPIAAMEKTLLRVGACDRAWLDAVAPAFAARLKALKQEQSASRSRTKV